MFSTIFLLLIENRNVGHDTDKIVQPLLRCLKPTIPTSKRIYESIRVSWKHPKFVMNNFKPSNGIVWVQSELLSFSEGSVY